MLHLTTAAKERLEIPPGCIVAVMKPSDGGNPCAIIYDIGVGMQIDQLSDQYGYVKKLAVDAQAMVNPIEVRTVEPGEDGPCEGRVFFARDRIVGRREVKDSEDGVNARIFVDLLGRTSALNVADTLDEMDGIEPKAPAKAA